MAKRNKPSAIQIAVYDMGSNPLPSKLVKEIEASIVKLLEGNPTIAHTVVTE